MEGLDFAPVKLLITFGLDKKIYITPQFCPKTVFTNRKLVNATYAISVLMLLALVK